MRKISNMIIEEGTEDKINNKVRNTVRAIIYEDEKLLLVYSNEFKDYTFPGGGVKSNEGHVLALTRELKEELGVDKIISIVPYGFIEEKKFGLNSSKNIYIQSSFYYSVKVGELGEQSLETRELQHGVEPEWVDLEQAIRINKLALKNLKNKKGMRTVLPRDLTVLKDFKLYIENRSKA